MRKIMALAGMELFFSVRRSGFIIYYAVLLLMAALLVHLLAGFFPGMRISSDMLRVNGPALTDLLQTIISLITTFMVASLTGSGAMRDYRYNSHELTFTSPVSRPQYLLGKFGGLYLASLFLFTAPLLGYALSSAAPWLDREAFVPFSITTYTDIFLQKTVVNIFFLSAAFYVLGLLFRNIVINWVGIILFYVLYILAGKYYSQADTRQLGALLDPYGLYGRLSLSVGSSAEQRNIEPIRIEGLYLWNRLIWTGVGMLFLLIGLGRFRFSYRPAGLRLRKAPAQILARTEAEVAPLPVPVRSFGSAFFRSTFASQFRLECRQLFRNVYFYLLGCTAIALLIFSSFAVGRLLETPGYPTTIRVLESYTDAMGLFLLLIIMVFSGEAVWRDRQHRLEGIIDSTPAARTVRLAAKTLSVYLPVLLLLGIILVAGILLQLSAHYTQLNIPLYLSYLFGYKGVIYLYYTILAMALQSLANGKYQGYFAFAAFYVVCNYFGYQLLHQGFLVPGHFPAVSYSDITGYQGAFYPFYVFAAYWLLFAILLWKAGVARSAAEERAPFRPALWLRRLQPRSRSAWMVSSAFVLTGLFIWYNTNVRNDHRSPDALNRLQADYEKKYRPLRTAPQLSLAAVQGNLDLFPGQRRMNARMQLTLVNKNQEPVRLLYLNLADHRYFRDWTCNGGWTPVLQDEKSGFYGYALAHPVTPGDSITLSYRFVYATEGFTDEGFNSMISRNGTFINNTVFLPVIGYDPAGELESNALRRKYGLPARPYAPLMTDTVARRENMLGHGADRIRLQLTLSTSREQTAIAPGYLRQQWQQGDRSYFRYEMDRPAVNYFSVQSGRYDVLRTAYRVPTDSARQVQLSVYYHPGHPYNVALMMKAMKDALAYYTGQFGPYPYRQLRIVEFPSASFAQSFANTIPFSENIGFLADLRDTAADYTSRSPVDYVYYVTAHEVAHQWWAHQILPANTEGANFLCEALAQYSALMLMKHQYGGERVRRFLEMESFNYLSARGNEGKEERPLATVLMDQQYIFYDKGACMLYALQHYLGEERINTVLRQFVKDYAFRERPYVTSGALVARLKDAAPDSLKYLVSDCLEKIVVYDNKIRKADYRMDDGTLEYRIQATISGKKQLYDAKGRQHDAPMNDWVTIGIYNKLDELVATQQVRLRSGEQQVSFVSSRRPDKLMINPDFDLQESDYLRSHSRVKVERAQQE